MSATNVAVRPEGIISIARVSAVGDRDLDRFGSPEEQHAKVARDVEYLELGRVIDARSEVDVSGHAPLEWRRDLLDAIERVEAGEARGIAFAYGNRKDRSMAVSEEVVRRIDACPWGVLIVDGQEMTHRTVQGWRRERMDSLMNEDQWRQGREVTMDNIEGRVARHNVVPHRLPVLGFVREQDGSVTVDDVEMGLVRESFQRRRDGATIQDVRDFLAEHGRELTYRQIRSMFASPLYVGEVRLRGNPARGKFQGTMDRERRVFQVVSPPPVDRDLYAAVQGLRVPREASAPSDRVLARTGVLRCSGCGGPMGATTVVQRWPRSDGTVGERRSPVYKCLTGTTRGCKAPVKIDAEVADREVLKVAADLLAGETGHASKIADARDAADRVAVLRADLDEATDRYLTLPALAQTDRSRQTVDDLAVALEQAERDERRLRDVADVESVDIAAMLADDSPATLAERRHLVRLALPGGVRVLPAAGRGRGNAEAIADRLDFLGAGAQ